MLYRLFYLLPDDARVQRWLLTSSPPVFVTGGRSFGLTARHPAASGIVVSLQT